MLGCLRELMDNKSNIIRVAIFWDFLLLKYYAGKTNKKTWIKTWGYIPFVPSKRTDNMIKDKNWSHKHHLRTPYEEKT